MNTEEGKGEEKQEQDELDRTFYYAVQKKLVNEVRECLKRGANVNYQPGDWIPLLYAIMNGYLEITELLVSFGADLSLRDTLGDTPLHKAARAGNNEIHFTIVFLYMGDTPLHIAALFGKTDICKCLLLSGADPTAINTKGETPLHTVALTCNTEISQLLILSGSDPTAVNKESKTYLESVRNRINPSQAVIERGRYKINKTREQNMPKLAKIAIPVNYLISSQNEDGDTKLNEAARAGNNEINFTMGFLYMGDTPLHVAAWAGITQICQLLISSGSDPTAVNKKGDTPIHKAAQGGNTEVCQLLISSGSDPTAVNKKGETPLHQVASYRGDVNTAKCLIIHGADLLAKTKMGKTPLDYAKEEGNTTMSAFLKKIINSNLPKEVQYLSGEDSESFGSLLKTGFYKSYVGKIMTVGHEAVGKTTITDVLRGKKPSKVRKSTEGIDVHTYQAAVDLEEKLWVKRELKPYDVAYRNLMIPSSSPKTDIESIDFDADTQGDSDLYDDYHHEETKHVKDDDNIWKSACNEDSLDTLPTYDVTRSVKDRIKDVFRTKVQITTNTLYANSVKIGKKVLVDKALVPVTMWDFAGQAAFYSTHQTFLTYRGIYIIPINVSIGFDDEIETESFIPGRHGKPTSREFTFFWICSILSYSKGETEGYPRIIPVFTHKDKVPPENLKERVNNIYEEIRRKFECTSWRKHLVLDRQICLNAIDSNDLGYEVLQNVLVDCLCSQPSWGEQLPKAWIPLQLVININREKGKKIMSFDKLLKANINNPVQVLTKTELMVFLKIMHAQGDILFFPLAGLLDYVIISPNFFVDALKSLITHKRFVTGNKRKFLQVLNETGQLQREEIFKIWKERKAFWKHREHLLAVMMHLDIISVPRKYTKSGTLMNSDFLYVPMIINKVDNTTYTKRPNLQGKVVAISFKFQSTILPAVGNRLIASCTDMFEVKQYEHQSMLFSGMVVLMVKKNLDLAVILRGDRIDVFLVHDEARFYIVSDTAVGLFECLADILSTISDSFKRVSSKENTEQQKQSFSVEYPCLNIESPCYKTTRTPWNCQHGHEINDAYLSIWTINRRKETCEPRCQGIKEGDFQHKPSELQLAKLSLELFWSDMYEIMIHLGMKVNELKAIEKDHGGGQEGMFLCLRKWKRKVNGTIGDLHKALTDSERDVHVLCKMNRDRPLDTLPDYLQQKHKPSDRDLDMIAAEVIDESILLTVQLGQDAKDWLQMKADNFKIVNINREILGKWREEKTTKSKKMEEIAQALCNVGIHISSILQEE